MLSASLSCILLVQPWGRRSRVGFRSKVGVPAKPAKKNPISATESSLAAGKKIYFKRCGTVTGRSEMAMDPMPLISVFIPQNFPIRACERTDGALFWKITRERSQCPPMNHASRRPSVGT